MAKSTAYDSSRSIRRDSGALIRPLATVNPQVSAVSREVTQFPGCRCCSVLAVSAAACAPQQSVSGVARPRNPVGTRLPRRSTDPPNARELVRPSHAICGFTDGVSPVEILEEPESPASSSRSSGSNPLHSGVGRWLTAEQFRPLHREYSNIFLITAVPLDSEDLEKRLPRRASARGFAVRTLGGLLSVGGPLLAPGEPRSLRSRECSHTTFHH